MNDTYKRLFGYSAGALILGGLAYAGFYREVEADVMTLLGSVEVHVKLASSIPDESDPTRKRLLAEAADLLERARKERPNLYLALEYEAWLAALAGKHDVAAQWFRKAQDGDEATAATKEQDLLNEARMWRKAGSPGNALATLDRWQAPMSPANAAPERVQRMLSHEEAGDAKRAVDLANAVVESSKDPMALLDAGHLLARKSEWGVAETAYEKAAYEKPIANYFRAKLKVRAREIDTGMDLLNRAFAADKRAVRALLKQDASDWSVVKTDARFKKLLFPESTPAKPGR